MGIESDQVVYEYLSRVGDVAQQRQLSSATRMRLVSQLRDEIDRCRARTAVDSPAAVRRILDRLGSPDDIVTAAGGTTGATGAPGAGAVFGAAPGAAPAPPPPAVPVQRDPGPARPTGTASGRSGGTGDEAEPSLLKSLRRVVPRPRPARPDPDLNPDPNPASPPPPPPGGALPPHLATADDLGDARIRPDWWRGEDSPFGLGDDVPAGFVGGVEIPDLLKAPPPRRPGGPAGPGTAPADTADTAPLAPDATEAVPESPSRRRFGLLPRRAAKETARARWSNPLLLLAAALLVGGAVTGNLFALLLGWVIAYGSRRLTPMETKWAVLGMPGLALAAGLLWLWGRGEGRWGAPIAQGQMNDAVGQTWPWVLRTAAVLSALFLVWRSQRRRG
ncbi:hypothetical protein ACFPC0_06640 [Streptomyces andamanensis]|uniref:Integral membrane protein n=1 Tax=Streptomyces andamanensis TaxID=1565035 RepID=A0ABV8TA77_9ACTN